MLMPRPGRAAVAAALAALMAGALAGCGGSPSRPPGSTTAVAASPPPSTAAQRTPEEQAVLNAYEQFWHSYLTATLTANPDEPALVARATGAALTQVRRQVIGFRTRKVTAPGDPQRIRTQLVSLSGRTAQILECLDSSRWLPDDDSTGGRLRLVRATLSQGADDIWRVSVLNIGAAEVDPRVAWCAA